MKTLEQETTEYIRTEKFQNRNRELYHPIGSVSHQQRIENQKAFMEWMLDKEPTFFITFLFNRRFDNQNVEQIVSYGKQKLHKFHKYIHRKLLGRYWYKPEIINPTEHMWMLLFPQDITTNLHFHGGVVVKNTKMFPNKIKMFLEYSNSIWTLDKELSTGERDVIVPNGNVDIQTPESIQRVSKYSTRDQHLYENYEHYYLGGS